uniref:Riboflavin synthase n=2 Tax=Noccaea caerulescens TaxID=107243 RepID=A0A1J3IST3_NOCCA
MMMMMMMMMPTHSLNLLPNSQLNFFASFRANLHLNLNLSFDSFSYGGSRRTPRRQNLSIRSVFTGIVEEMGHVTNLGFAHHGGFDLKIGARVVLEDVKLGDSIAVNGTCLTVTDFDAEEFTVGLSPETLRKTSLEELETGSPVNLERALQPVSRMGGHVVQGHVDGTGVIVSMEVEGDSLWVKVKADKGLLKYIVPKGYVAVDGTSLTVVDVFDQESCFNFMMVAYTQHKVVIPTKRIGHKVNLEVDIMGKYVERLLTIGGGFSMNIPEEKKE